MSTRVGTPTGEIVVHVGTEVTGAAVLQRWIARNEALLVHHGLRPATAARPASGAAKLVVPWKDPGALAWHLLAEEVAAHPTQGFVLSNENLWRQSQEVLLRLRTALTGRRVRIVLYVREQAEYLQAVTLEHQRNLDKAFDLGNGDAVARFTRPRRPAYHDVCRRFEAVFGDGSVTARSADPSALVGGHLITDFCSLVGVEPPAPDRLPREEPVLTPVLATALRTRRKDLKPVGPPPDQLDLALRLSAAGVGRPWFLPERNVVSMRMGYRGQNARFAAAYLSNAEDLPGRPAYAPAPDGAEDVDAAVEAMLRHARIGARIGRSGWGGGPGVASRLFADGWELVPSDQPVESGSGAEPARVVAVPCPGVATIRFRLPLERLVDRTPTLLDLRTVADEPLVARCSVNGSDAGILHFPHDRIRIPVDELDVVGLVEIALHPVGDEPLAPVAAVRLIDA